MARSPDKGAAGGPVRPSRPAGRGRGFVAAHLLDQRLGAVELGFAADPFDEVHLDDLVVQVAGEVEQIDFEERRAVVEGRPSAKARHAVPQNAVDRGADRVNPVRQPGRGIEADIGGRVAERTPELVAVDDRTEDEIVASQEHGRLAHPPGLEQAADRGRGHGVEGAVLVGHDLVDDPDPEPVPAPRRGQELGRAAPTSPEMKIVADDGRRDAEAPHQNLGHEILGTERREGTVEAAHDHALDRAEPCQGQRLGGLRRDAEDGAPPSEEVGRMRLEGQHRAGPAELLRERLGAADHGLMAAVHAVEIADRNDARIEAWRRACRVDRDDEPRGKGSAQA